MENQSIKQALAEDIKKEILMDLNLVSARHNQEQRLIDNIKQEVLLELNQQHLQQQPPPNKEFIEVVKNEVLAKIKREGSTNPVFTGNFGYPDRATIEAIKREVITQLKTEQEKSTEQQETNVDPALVQAVKNSVLAEINAPHHR
ncbi:MAG: hypothetical protein GX334_04750 [Firmicutes bacterium]|nr:hypothetical protein [Bacillota bacterium]